MSLIFFGRIADLGAHGLLALTLDHSHYAPLPAHRHGRYTWHDPQGGRHDRMALCTRAIDAAALTAALDAQRQRFGRAVAAVRGPIDWVAAQVADDFREAPYAVGALDGGRVLLVFGDAAGPKQLRVVDVPANRVLYEEAVDELCARLQVRRLIAGQPFDAVLHATGGPWAAIWLGDRLELLQLRDGRLERAAVDVLRQAERFALTPETWYWRATDSQDVHVLAAADGGREVACVTSPHARRGIMDLAGASAAGRALLSHPGGTIEWLDTAGRSEGALRPFPALARKDAVGGQLAPDGRHVLAGADTLVLVDLERGRQAEVADDRFSFDHGDHRVFHPEVRYRSETRAGLHGLLRVREGVLSLEPYDSFDWQPALVPGAKGRRSATPDATAWAGLRKPAWALKPARKGSGGWQLYGAPHLHQAADWPRHDGRPMLLLCQFDLAAAAVTPPLPTEGALLFFVAADAEFEPALDDSFNPAAWRVLWVPALAATPLPAGDADLPAAQPVKLAADTAVWPQPDAPIVQAQGWPSAKIESYRQFVDASQPDGPGPGHRLGGYPTVVQHNDLELDAAHAAGDEGAPARWRLLLQLDSDDVFMWGTDSGTLYFMVHDDDLAQRDFTRVVALTQGA